MKIKSVFLASSLLLFASVIFADNNSALTSQPSSSFKVVRTIHFVVTNNTGAPITDLYAAPGIENLMFDNPLPTPLPVGVSNFYFDVIDTSAPAGVAINGGNVAGNFVTFQAGTMPHDNTCETSGTLSVTCHGTASAHHTYEVDVVIGGTS